MNYCKIQTENPNSENYDVLMSASKFSFEIKNNNLFIAKLNSNKRATHYIITDIYDTKVSVFDKFLLVEIGGYLEYEEYHYKRVIVNIKVDNFKWD